MPLRTSPATLRSLLVSIHQVADTTSTVPDGAATVAISPEITWRGPVRSASVRTGWPSFGGSAPSAGAGAPTSAHAADITSKLRATRRMTAPSLRSRRSGRREHIGRGTGVNGSDGPESALRVLPWGREPNQRCRAAPRMPLRAEGHRPSRTFGPRMQAPGAYCVRNDRGLDAVSGAGLKPSPCSRIPDGARDFGS